MPRSKEFVSSSESESEEPKPKKTKVEKNTKKEKEHEKDSSTAGGSMTGDKGEQMYQLSRMRFVSVSEFRGKKMVNIREYYEADGELKPGRKGISLMEDQWTKLKSYINQIDEDLDK